MAPRTFLLTFAGAAALAVAAVTAQPPAPDAERAALTRKLRAAETRLYAAQLRLAWREWQHGALPEFLAALDECSPEMRHWEHAYLRRLCEDRVRVVDTGLRDILAEAFSPDGKWLAAAGIDQTVRIWDARTGALHRRLKGHPGLVSSLAFSNDTRGTGRLCLASASGTEIRIWDVATGESLQTVASAPGNGYGSVLAFSPDGRWLANAESPGRGAEQPGAITIWDRTLGKQAFALRGHRSGVLNLAFSPDGKRLASAGLPPLASGPGEVKVWELASHGLALELKGHDLKGHEAALAGLAFSPDGRRLATACHDATIYLWDLASGKPARVLKGHERAVTAVAFSADGRRLVSSAIDHTVRVWDLTGVKKPIILDGTQGVVLGTLRCVSFSLDGQRVAAWSGDGTLWGWGLTATQDTILLKGHRQKVTCLAFGAGGARLLSGGGLVYDDKGEELWGEVRMWDTPAGRESLAVGEHTAWITALAVSPDGKSFASGSSDRIVTFGEVASGHTKRIFRGHRSAVTALAFQPGGTLLAAAEADGPVRLWDTATRKPSLLLKGQDGRVQCLAFSADGKRLACAAWSGVHVWDVATGVGSKTPLVGKAALHNTTFSPDGKWLAGGAVREKAARPGVVFIWDAATGREVMALEGHDGRVAAVAFSPDGRRLASAGVDGTVRIWDLGVGLEVYRLGGLPKTVRCLAFSPDGRYLACGAGETVRVWDSGVWRKGKG